jgi:hypothetical protein
VEAVEAMRAGKGKKDTFRRIAEAKKRKRR